MDNGNQENKARKIGSLKSHNAICSVSKYVNSNISITMPFVRYCLTINVIIEKV